MRALVLQMLFYIDINLTWDWAHSFIERLPLEMLPSAMVKIYVFHWSGEATDRHKE